MPKRRERPSALADVSQTRGRARAEKPLMGPATCLATRSASAMAMRLGTSSPTTMEKYETTSVMRTVAMPPATAASRPRDARTPPSGSDRLVAANAELKKPTNVMATWMAARKVVSFSMTETAWDALASPSSLSCSSMTRLAVERAISDIEKYPLTMVSRIVTVTEMTTSMRERATS